MVSLAKPDSRKAVGSSYDHSKFEGRRNFLRWLIDQIGFRFLAKIESVEGVNNLPRAGPGIVMINHIALIDPIVVLGQLPRNVVPLAKAEAFHLPLIGIFPRIWNAIPVHREEFDRNALRMAFAVLKAGELLMIAPEGTRNPHLQNVREGITYLASKADVPIIPAVVTGTPDFPTLNRKKWRNSGIHIRIGRPIQFHQVAEKRSRELLRKMTNEVMYVLAALLPPELRGEYADLELATSETYAILDAEQIAERKT